VTTFASRAPNGIWGLCIEYRFNNSYSWRHSQTYENGSLETFSTSPPPIKTALPNLLKNNNNERSNGRKTF